MNKSNYLQGVLPFVGEIAGILTIEAFLRDLPKGLYTPFWWNEEMPIAQAIEEHYFEFAAAANALDAKSFNEIAICHSANDEHFDTERKYWNDWSIKCCKLSSKLNPLQSEVSLIMVEHHRMSSNEAAIIEAKKFTAFVVKV